MHDAKTLCNIMADYIEKNKITNHTYLYKQEVPISDNLVKEYPIAVAFSKDFMQKVMNIRKDSLE